jgi:hypothetical protein
MKYIIKLGDGYYGTAPYTPMPKQDAVVFPTMKAARKQLNRLQGRLMKNTPSSIEKDF